MKWHIIAALALEILYISSGLILCIIGKNMLEKGIKADFSADGEIANKKFRIITSAPGLVFLLAGLVIVVTTITNKSKYTESSLYQILESTNNDEIQITDSLLENNKYLSSSMQDQSDKIDSLKVVIAGGTIIQPIKNKAEYHPPKVVFVQKKDPMPTPSSVLIKQIKSYELFSKTTIQTMAEDLYKNAIDEKKHMNQAQVLNDLSMAITLNPSLYNEYLKSEEFKYYMNDTAFEYLLRARLQILLKAQEEQPISENALMVINNLKIYILAQPKTEITPELLKLIHELPKSPVFESTEKTKERIRVLIKKDAQSFLDLLNKPDYRWLLLNDEIITWLRKESDSFFKNI